MILARGRYQERTTSVLDSEMPQLVAQLFVSFSHLFLPFFVLLCLGHLAVYSGDTVKEATSTFKELSL